MSKSAIYCANTNEQNINSGGTINFGNIVRRFGAIDMSGGNITTGTSGYYDVDVNLTVAGTVAGSTTFQVYFNGAAIAGAVASATTSATSVNTLNIPCLIRQTCCCDGTITVVANGSTVNITNAGIVVSKC